MSTSKKRMAGKSSGVRRAKLAKLRQSFVLAAFERLKPKYQMQPFSEEAIDALEKEFRRDLPVDEYGDVVPESRPPSDKLMDLLDDDVSTLLEEKPGSASLYDASRETLKKDLKALGIRSKLRKQRSG
jgi:hypothetical protein